MSEGFSKSLEIQGVGYRADVKGNKLNLLQSSASRTRWRCSVPKGSPSRWTATRRSIEGIDKQLVGQFAADVRSIRPPEPYKGKGIRYAGEHVPQGRQGRRKSA